MIAGAIVLLAAIVGTVAGVVLRAQRANLDVTDSPTPGPTGAPTTETFQNDAIMSFLTDKVTGGTPFKPDTSHSLAANWIINIDPLQIKKMSDRLIRRFALVLFYFETTLGGKSFWKRCNPPTDGEDDECVTLANVVFMRWLTGSDECTWYGIYCNDKSGPVHQIVLRK